MFQWLAKMLLNTPVGSAGCPCGEAKRIKLEKMRREITGENAPHSESEIGQSKKKEIDFFLCSDEVCRISVDKVKFGEKKN